MIYIGSPDHIVSYDTETGKIDDENGFYYDEVQTTSFGWFQTSIDGSKVFKYSEEKCHDDISREIVVKLVGKAVGNEYVRDSLGDIKKAIDDTMAYAGRIFNEQNVVTTWYRLSSNTLRDCLDRIGGVDKFVDFIYSYNEPYDNTGIHTVGEYLKLGISSNQSEDDRRYETTLSGLIDKQIQQLIKNYNSSHSAWQQDKEKKGWKTIAQRNFILNNENKELNNIVMNAKRYKEEFSNYIGIMKEALERENFEAYDAAKDMLEESIEECRHEKALAAELDTNNFGILNHIFEERLPELFKSNKKAVRDVVKLIREDSNLSSEFSFYNSLRKYNSKMAEIIKPIDLASRLNEAIVPTINQETVLKSNAKLRKVMKEHNIIPNDFVSDEMKKLYESGHNLLTKKRNLNNVVMIAESTKNICDYMDAHKNDVVKESIDPAKLMKNFENKLRETLTESEMSFVKEITDWRSPIAEQRKEKLFNKFKNECIDKVNDMLKEDAGNVELVSLKKQLEEQKFNKETIVQDIAKLLEIRDILLDN